MLSSDTARMVRDLWQYRANESRQSNRVALLIAIACCIGWIRWGYPMVTATKTTAAGVTSAVTDAIAPDLSASPKAGDKIGPYVVSSAYDFHHVLRHHDPVYPSLKM